MSDLINLNKARKARAAQAAVRKAVENRAKFGRTKLQKAADRAKAAKSERGLDGAKREP